MSHRKNHNPIVFLTTLGVYLGLVLVGGAAPQVLAHSATTRNYFEITDEIEVKDDLDRNPGDEASTLVESVGVYLQDVELFLYSLRRLSAERKFDLTRDTFRVGQSTLLPCIPANKIGSYTADSFETSNEAIRPWLETFSKRLTDGYSLPDCLPNRQFDGGEATSSRFEFRLDRAELAIEVAVKKGSPGAAKLLFTELSRTLRQLKPSTAVDLRGRIYENTSFHHQSDQVLVITRLPRAALGALLAKDAE